jgi:hypothetical protein
MIKKNRYCSHVAAFAMLLLGMTISPAWADDDDEESSLFVVTNAAWKEECGGCHIAYPPRFLPAQSWRALMSGLDKHFGSDASVDVATAQEISNFLEKNSDPRRRQIGGKVILRISETRWFESEHDEISPRTWKNPKIKSPANCGACHTQVDLGDFSEHNVKIPR